jgi:hypothetical protein
LWGDEDFITSLGLDADEPAPAQVMAAIQESRTRNPGACNCFSCLHAAELESLLTDFAKQWGTALKLYSGRIHQSQPDYQKLYLRPHVSLPEKDLILWLLNEQKTLHLLLLTARHELGNVYMTVVEWHERAQSRLYLDRENHCLTDRQLGLISARARGYHYLRTVPIASGEWQEQRNDGPGAAWFEHDSSLAWLYWSFFHLWYEDVYYDVVRVPQCRWSGCTRFLPPRSGAGDVREYCDEHRVVAKRQRDRESQARRRKELKRASARIIANQK